MMKLGFSLYFLLQALISRFGRSSLTVRRSSCRSGTRRARSGSEPSPPPTTGTHVSPILKKIQLLFFAYAVRKFSYKIMYITKCQKYGHTWEFNLVKLTKGGGAPWAENSEKKNANIHLGLKYQHCQLQKPMCRLYF